jgi:hypothetical protein
MSKKFGEWYQKTNKTEDTDRLTLLAFKNNRHPSQNTVGNVHKASGNCQQRPLQESIAEPLSHVLGLPRRQETAFHNRLLKER